MLNKYLHKKKKEGKTNFLRHLQSQACFAIAILATNWTCLFKSHLSHTRVPVKQIKNEAKRDQLIARIMDCEKHRSYEATAELCVVLDM